MSFADLITIAGIEGIKYATEFQNGKFGLINSLYLIPESFEHRAKEIKTTVSSEISSPIRHAINVCQSHCCSMNIKKVHDYRSGLQVVRTDLVCLKLNSE